MVEAVEETKKVAEEVKETVRSTKSIVLKIAKQGKQNLGLFYKIGHGHDGPSCWIAA